MSSGFKSRMASRKGKGMNAGGSRGSMVPRGERKPTGCMMRGKKSGRAR